MSTVTLEASHGIDRTVVLSDETELMPTLPLGDVLAEELDLDVPYGSLIVIQPEGALDAMPGAVSYQVGTVVGEAMLGLIERGMFGLDVENRALFTMAASYSRLAEGAEFRHLGLSPEWFRSGLGASLGAYWSGARTSRTETSGMFVSPDFLSDARLHAYLLSCDASFRAPRSTPASLMSFHGGLRSYDEWLEEAERSVSSHIAREVQSSRHAMSRDR
ncbi:hypothetical protein [Histidinibacterium aquaticum]|uniref:Uncharacterized protein n=1 Tax=Histidinibacterium aquaticum TaxID=2613962 RepID=A0A5J5GP88_9RHOB|nr:hypothetical protein [Histidinibacterium aquaticum]KAA9009980.1 hypothetical protein F3S47_01575 [Histidinibacterium aquaticum]